VNVARNWSNTWNLAFEPQQGAPFKINMNLIKASELVHFLLLWHQKIFGRELWNLEELNIICKEQIQRKLTELSVSWFCSFCSVMKSALCCTVGYLTAMQCIISRNYCWMRWKIITKANLKGWWSLLSRYLLASKYPPQSEIFSHLFNGSFI
jgi:hypothetical protein